MKPALKLAWVKALRSGKYKQGTNVLRDEFDGKQTFCCLGVLADVAGRKWGSSGAEGDRAFWLGKHSDTLLPDGFARECGLGSGRSENSPQCELAKMNDSGQTFKQIAAWIEKNL